MEKEELIVLLRRYFELRDAEGGIWTQLELRQVELKLRQEVLTDNDRAMIAKAEDLHYCDWSHCSDYMKQCDTSSARSIINNRMSLLYHTEEAHSDNI